MTTKAKDTGAKDAPSDAAARAAAETFETMAQAGRESVDAAVKAGTDAMSEAFDTAVSVGESQIKRSGEAYKSAGKLGKDNIAAFNAAAGTVAAGCEAYGEKLAEYAKTATSENFELMGRFMSARTPEELASLQMEAATRSVDRFMTQSMELNRIATDTFMKCATPMKRQYDSVMQNFTKSFAG